MYFFLPKACPSGLTRAFYQLLTCFLLLGAFAPLLQAQNKPLVVSGKVADSLANPIAFVAIGIADPTGKIWRGTQSDKAGNFSLTLSEENEKQSLTLILQHVNYQTLKKEIRPRQMAASEGDTLFLSFVLTEKSSDLATVVIETQAMPTISTLRPNAESLLKVPTPFDEFNQKLATLGLGIVSNSELSSTYQVRGGSYEENLVYVNGMEVYRPFLVSAGQQEGLSFVNPEMVAQISFSSGGWQPKFGDKLSSVLDIEYKTPKKWGGSATLGLLGGSTHVEGISKSKKMNFIVGLRHKDARYLFNTLETNGQYLPRFTDLQGLFTLQMGKNSSLQVLTSVAQNRYQVLPQSRQTTFGTFDRQMRLFVAYSGNEIMNYTTYQGSARWTHFSTDKRLKISWITSAINTQEREFIDVNGAYRLCDVDNDPNSNTFNQCALIRGVGAEYKHARNVLQAQIFSFQNRSHFQINSKNEIEWGFSLSHEQIEDQLYEYSVLDSAGFVKRNRFLDAQLETASQRLAFYAQHQKNIGKSYQHKIIYGLRGNYWSLNRQFLLSPRLQYQYAPLHWKKDITFQAAVGLYQQPPFYRELRNFEGVLNTNLRAQTALHVIAGLNWAFKSWERPFQFIAETYYKHLWNVIPYDIDNVRLRYYAQNNAIAYVAGADLRLSGELIKGTESWVALSLMTAREDVDFDTRGFIRRPTDQRVTATMYFEDFLPNDPTWRMNIRLMFGSGLPFSVPNRADFRSVFSAPAYRRVDIGFSKLVVFRPNQRLKSIWLGAEVLNLLGVENIISYLWVRDFVNDFQFAVPNGLSQRFFNLKAVIRW
jgi:hypothetical protein